MDGITGFSGGLFSFIGVLLVLVIAHELGHFTTAKLAKITVQEFGLGYPPKLFGKKFKGTEYTLNLLPLGGFVRLLGEEDPSETGSFASKGILPRIIVLAAGSGMNALLPVVLLTVSLLIPRETVAGPVFVRDVAPDSPAMAAGFQPGDVIERINDRTIESQRDVTYNVQLNTGNDMAVTLLRGGQTLVQHVTPRWAPPKGQGATGIVIGMDPGQTQHKTAAMGLPDALGTAVRTSFDMLTLFKNGIYSMFVPHETDSGPAVTGPIGIAQATGEVAKTGIQPLLEWMAFLSMNLAIMNILPIPMLDGGRIVFVLIEWVRRGRRISPEREGFVHAVGFAVLMGLVIIVSFFDVQRLVTGGNIIR